MSLTIIPALISDAVRLAPLLRACDRAEIAAATGEDPLPVLLRGVASSHECKAVLDENMVPIAMFGAVPDAARDGAAMVWMMGSESLAHHRRELVGASREWIDRMHERFDTLWNWVDARNHVHVRWLAHCGFLVVGEVENFGVEGRRFMRVERCAHHSWHESPTREVTAVLRDKNTRAKRCLQPHE